MQLMLMQQHFAQLLHLSEVNFSYQRDNNAIPGDVVVAIVAATARCTRVALSAEFKHELNNLPLTEKRFLLGKNSSEQIV
jgi:hypothetical protein